MSKELNNKRDENFREFYESVAQLYPEEKLVYSSLRGILRRRFVLTRLEKLRGVFLELGCNRGFYISHYKNGLAIGVDIAYAVLKEAQKRHPVAYFIQGDVQYLAFIRSNSFDSILCSEVIEHVLYPQKVLAECFRILKPQGKLLITTPNYKRKKPYRAKLGKMKSFGVKGIDGDYYFHTAFRPEELKSMAEKAGFQVLESGTLEKEVKYSTRIPLLFYYLLHILNKYTFHSREIDDFNEKMVEKCSLLIYKVCTFLRLNDFFSRLVKEGVRSYLFVQK